MRILLFVLSLCLPHIVGATCQGNDLRAQLTGAEKQELATLMADVPFASGNHWLAEKDGRRIHVIGTLHVNDPRLDPITARLEPLVQRADLLLLEATQAEETKLQSAMASDPEIAFITQGPTLLELMDPKDWERIAAAANQRGIPPFMAAKFQPWMLSLTLGLPVCVLKDMQAGGQGLDHRLRDIAANADVVTKALEPYDTIFKIASADPIEQQIKWLSLSTLSEMAGENAIHTLMQQYFEEEHGAVIPLARITGRAEFDMPVAEFNSAFDGAMQGLLDDRNRAWMSVIKAAQGEQIVVAVGAGHLAGQNGLLNLLAQEGYQMSRQTF